MGGAGTVPSAVNNIDFFLIATTGNTQDFGDLTSDMMGSRSIGCDSPTRACAWWE